MNTFLGKTYDEIILLIGEDHATPMFKKHFADLGDDANHEKSWKMIIDTIDVNIAKMDTLPPANQEKVKSFAKMRDAMIADLDENYGELLDVKETQEDSLGDLMDALPAATTTEAAATKVDEIAASVEDALKDNDPGDEDLPENKDGGVQLVVENWDVSELSDNITVHMEGKEINSHDIAVAMKHVATLLMIAPYCSIPDMTQVPAHIRKELKASLTEIEATHKALATV